MKVYLNRILLLLFLSNTRSTNVKSFLLVSFSTSSKNFSKSEIKSPLYNEKQIYHKFNTIMFFPLCQKNVHFLN
jgi:hypothetical protein